METVLIIEDDSTMLRGLKDNFAYAGYNVITAADGEVGLNAALDAKPDLIILDIMLPKINGYEICRLIRKENGYVVPHLVFQISFISFVSIIDEGIDRVRVQDVQIAGRVGRVFRVCA